MNSIRVGIVGLVLALALLPASVAVAHPGHGQFTASPTSQADNGGGGTSTLVIAAVAVGLIGLAAGLGSLKYIQTQKARDTSASQT